MIEKESTNILLVYSSLDGQTLKICEHLQHTLGDASQVQLRPVERVHGAELQEFNKVIVAGSVRYGKHAPALYEFIETNYLYLSSIKSGFFSVNVVARKSGKDSVLNNPYLQKFLKDIPWRPDILAVFAGRINYKKYSFWNKHMIRAIMWMTKGPTDLNTDKEFTNWQAVEEFRRDILLL